jgi:predicted nucleotidyltransferase
VARTLANLPQSIREAVELFAARVRELAGAQLRQLCVFGSYARDDATPASDVDVAVVIDELSSQLKSQILDVTGEIFLDREVLVSPVILPTDLFEKWRRQERRLVRDILRDGIAA